MLQIMPRPDQKFTDVLTKSQMLRTELWRRRLADARSRYEAAVNDLRRAIEANSEGATSRDGWQEILEVRFRESDALSEYITVLRTFAEMVS